MRIGVIGCGAIADAFHLPAVVAEVGAESVVLVDPSEERAGALARKFGIRETLTAHGDLAGRVDAAIVATPHHTHVPIALDLLEAGIPVLSEKPLGTSVAEIERLIAAAARTGLPVAVNQTRRFIPACREIHRFLAEGALGRVTEVDACEGDKFGWPAATPSMFGRRSGGKGVLLDIGVHTLDLLTWWLGAEARVDAYRDDSFGGSEAAAAVDLSFGDLRIAVRLSWLAKQSNRYRIVGTEGTLEWGVYDLDLLTLRSTGSGRTRKIEIRGGPPSFADLAPEVVRDFLRAVRDGVPPAVPAESVVASMRIIEDCYARRERFDMPWHPFEQAVRHVQ